MHVLRQLHKTLRPGGVLLDIHPQPTHPRIAVIVSGRSIPIGALDASQDNSEIREAQKRLAAVQRAGLFRTERRTRLTMRTYHDSVEAWLEYRKERDATNIIPPEVLRGARRAMKAEGAILAVISSIRAGALARVEVSSRIG